MQIRQRDDVDLDLVELATAYERRKDGLGERFIQAYQLAVDRIASDPLAWRKIRRDVRRYLIREFEVWVVYRVFEETVEILVVVHGARSMDSWSNRLDD